MLLNPGLCSITEKAKNREIINNLNNKRNSSTLLATSMSTSTTGNQVKKVSLLTLRKYTLYNYIRRRKYTEIVLFPLDVTVTMDSK